MGTVACTSLVLVLIGEFLSPAASSFGYVPRCGSAHDAHFGRPFPISNFKWLI